MKKISVGFVVLLAVLVIFAGCQKSGGGTGAADPYANMAKEITVGTFDRGAVPAAEGNYEQNRWVTWINEHSPVKVTIVPYARGDSWNLLNAMFASGTAPDLVWEYNRVALDRFYDQGVLQAVDTYIEQYSTAYKKYLQDNPGLIPFITGPDGKQYGITSYRTPDARLNQGIFVRKDWLDRFGMSIPTTIDEALAFMRRAKAENASGHPQGTWGVGSDGNWALITTAIFGKPSLDFYVENDHFVDWFTTPAYRASLQFLQQVYAEGLIDPEYVTDNPNYSRQNEFLTTGRIAMRFSGVGLANQYRTLMENVPTADFVGIGPLSTPVGKYGFGLESDFFHMVTMNKLAKNPKACIEFIDWMITDGPNGGWWTLSYGEEGRHYRMVNGVPQVIDADLNARETVYLNNGEIYALVDNKAAMWNTSWITATAAPDAISQDWARRYAAMADLILATPFRRYVVMEPSGPLTEAFRSGISDQVSAFTTDIMMGRLSVDEGLAQINAYKNSMGWAAVNAEKEAWWQANKNWVADREHGK